MNTPSGIKFPFRFQAGSIALSEGDKNIKEAVSILLGTGKGEYLYQPEYGSDLRRRIFDSTNVKSLIKRDVTVAIAQFEPRVELMDVETEAGTTPSGGPSRATNLPGISTNDMGIVTVNIRLRIKGSDELTDLQLQVKG